MNDQHPLLTETSGTPTRPASSPGETTRPASAAPSPTTAATAAPATAPTVIAGSVPEAVLPPGTPAEIGGVRLIRLLGKGAMGEVYLGRHRTMDVDVAVKLMMQKQGADADRFLQEVRAAARIQHAHVIQVMNAGIEHDRLFLVMELVTGGDVSQLIRREGSLPWRRAVTLAIQAADGLGAAHRAGIVHRDVKPANFVLTGDGTLKVADLGMAKRQNSGDVELTHSGVVMGTPAYMAPEQAIDTRRAGPPADVYALGVALFHLLCGRLPFQAETSNAMLLAHANQPVPDVRTLAIDVPEDVVALVKRLLDKDPGKRPADGNAAAAELREVLAAHPAGVASPRRFPVGGVLVALIILVAAALAVLLVWPGATPTTTPPDTAAMAPGTATVVAGGGTSATVPPATPVSATLPDRPAAVAVPAVAADPWQTPTRAVFVLSADPQSIDAAAIESALVEAKVLLVERTALDQALVTEAALVQNGQVDLASAVRTGKLVGGHVALLVRQADGRVALRAVLIETGELVGSQVVDPAAISDTAQKLVRDAVALLPAKGRLSREVDGTWQISLGRHHAVAVGDRFKVLAGDVATPGVAVAVATVDAVTATTATVSVAGATPTTLPALVIRIAP